VDVLDGEMLGVLDKRDCVLDETMGKSLLGLLG
jgi:hypothetical protein